MEVTTSTSARKQRGVTDVPYHVAHASFEVTGADALYDGSGMGEEDYAASHMPDDVTQDCARRMHYCAYRMEKTTEPRERTHWKNKYRSWRDQIVLGNRKLVYRAVRRWMPTASLADDMTGDCQIVLIQAVAAYNPWLGIRFSTYAFTCLMRALSRLSQRHAADRLSQSCPLEALPDGEPRDQRTEDVSANGLPRIDEYLREGNDLLSMREKMVLIRRFSLDEKSQAGTLEQVGREMGLSKERVRQVQATALEKLRNVLVGAGHTA